MLRTVNILYFLLYCIELVYRLKVLVKEKLVITQLGCLKCCILAGSYLAGKNLVDPQKNH